MLPILESAYKAWSAADTLRAKRERYKNYTYGDQWCDPVRTSSGKIVREDELISRSGCKPLTNNLIRQLVKAVVGRWRSQSSERGIYTRPDIADVSARNSLAELDSRLLEEFLISGCAIQRIVDERRWGGCGVWVDNVDPTRFFVNAFRDPRGWDIDMAGMLHDMTLPEVINRFAGGDAGRAEAIRHVYRSAEGSGALSAPELGVSAYSADFFCASSPERCRVIEVWSLDCRDGESAASFDFVWHCRFLAPDGTLLREYDSPYSHGSHPFVVKFYPLTDGEVHPFVEDVIDQQRHINRLIVMLDRMMSSAAKGVLLFPEDQMSQLTTWHDISAIWAHSDGVIPITGRGEHLPQQVVTNTADSGAYQLLELQMRLFRDVSGVGDSILGHTSSSASGAQMLESQVRNATIALADIFDTFQAFIVQRNEKAGGLYNICTAGWQ